MICISTSSPIILCSHTACILLSVVIRDRRPEGRLEGVASYALESANSDRIWEMAVVIAERYALHVWVRRETFYAALGI